MRFTSPGVRAARGTPGSGSQQVGPEAAQRAQTWAAPRIGSVMRLSSRDHLLWACSWLSGTVDDRTPRFSERRKRRKAKKVMTRAAVKVLALTLLALALVPSRAI